MSDPAELYLLDVARSTPDALLLTMGAWLVLGICALIVAGLR